MTRFNYMGFNMFLKVPMFVSVDLKRRFSMNTVLLLTSSVFGEKSKSRQVALELLDAWRRSHPGARVIERNLDAQTMPHLSGEALMHPTKLADRLIEEVEASDVLIVAAPMYNFSIPSTLKAWIDHIARAGRTFRYTESGAQGLLKGKKVFVVVSRGGIYDGVLSGQMMDFQKPYLRAMLGFLGLTDVTFIHAEGQNVSAEAAADGLARARNSIADAVPQILAA